MRLAVCSEMVFLDLPIVERVRRIADLGFDAEPGTGEINYPAIAAALADLGYSGTVGLEAWAADGDSERALARFRAAFTLPPPNGATS